MATPGATIKFLGIDSYYVELSEKRSSRGNNKQEYYTAADILNAASSSTDTDLFFVDAMTTTALPTSTYDNGTAGVGATITADANGAIGVIDGYTVVVNDILAIKDQANGFENGIYEVTTLGDGSNPFVLTRVSYYDSTAEVYPSLVTVVNGDANGSLYYLQTTDSPTIGTDSIVFETSTAPVVSSSETQVFFVNTATSANLSGTPTYSDGPDAALPGQGATLAWSGAGISEVINGVTLVVNDFLLVKNQTNAEQNGVYRVTKVKNNGKILTLTREDVYADNIYPILVHVSDPDSDYHKNMYTSTATTVATNADVGTENVSYELVSELESIVLAVSDETTALTTGTAKMTFRMPYAFELSEVRASLTGAGSTSGTTTIDINEGGVSILSTEITIDNTEKTSTTAATPAVISDANLADDAEITIDIDAVTGGADETGLKVMLIGRRV